MRSVSFDYKTAMLSLLPNQNSSRNMTGKSRYMARAGGALNSKPHHTHALVKQKTLFSSSWLRNQFPPASFQGNSIMNLETFSAMQPGQV